MTKNKQGFTLIELLVVIAIIAILSAIGLVALNGAREKARDAQRRSDIAQIRTALTLYYDDHDSTYPDITNAATVSTANIPDASDDSADAGAVGSTLITGGGLTSNYLAQELRAPTADAVPYDHYYYVTNMTDDGAGTVTASSSYMVFTQLEAAGGLNYYGINEEGSVWDIGDDITALPTVADGGGAGTARVGAADICDAADLDGDNVFCGFENY